MNLTFKFAVAAAMTLAAPAAFAATPLFTDSLQGTLANGNWAGNNSGQIVAAPGGGTALNFASLGTGSDLTSILFGSAGAGIYRVSVDYYCGTSQCGGFLGFYPGGSLSTNPSGSGDGWLATDTPALWSTPFALPNTGGWATLTFDVSVNSAGPFGLKLEDFPGTPGAVAGDAFFRNLSVSAVPESSTWAMMLAGFGVIGFGLRRRRRETVSVTYA
ncbi:MAG: putative exosortase interaction domain protein [Bradyrhizobium sp.]|nr:putative exosortase interaction domain protein [Bradyrhizobium sp.]